MSTLRLNTLLSMDGTQFHAGVAKAKTAVAGLSTSLNSQLKGQVAGAFGVAAIGLMVHRTMQLADSIKRNEATFGIPADQLQEWSYAANMADTDLQSVLTSYKRMARARDEALRNPSGQSAQDFRSFGYVADSLRTSSPEQLMYAVARAAGAAEEDTAKFAASLRLLGRNADEVLPALKNMEAGIGKNAPKLSDGRLIALQYESDKFKEAFASTTGAGGQFVGVLSTVHMKLANLVDDALGLIGVIKGAALDNSQSIPELWARFNENRIGRDMLYNEVVGISGKGAPRRGMVFGRNDTGATVTEMNGVNLIPSRFASTPGEMESAAETMAKAAQQAERARFEQLKHEEKLAELMRKEAELKKEIESFGLGPYTPGQADKMLQLAQIQAAIAQLGPVKQSKELPNASRTGDEFIRVGNFIGEGGSVLQNIAAQQLEVARQQVTQLREIKLLLQPQRQQTIGVP